MTIQTLLQKDFYLTALIEQYVTKFDATHKSSPESEGIASAIADHLESIDEHKEKRAELQERRTRLKNIVDTYKTSDAKQALYDTFQQLQKIPRQHSVQQVVAQFRDSKN